jgi:RES domain-containing protein
VVYLAEHPALAALEVRVHLDLPLDLLPDDYVLVQVSLPDQPIGRIEEVPGNTEDAGDVWLRAGETAVLIVPSILIPHSWNLLLNPAHPAGAGARAVTVEPFRFDPRLWRPS